MRTFQDIRDKIDTYILPDDQGNLRIYNYLRYRQDEIDTDLKALDERLLDAARTLGSTVTSTWLRQARHSLASDILERKIESWDEVGSTEHTQIMLWICRTTNFSGLRSWVRTKLARR